MNKLISCILGFIALVLFIICLNKTTVLAIIQQIATIVKELVNGQCDIGAIKVLASLVVQAIHNLGHNIFRAINWLISRLPG